MTGRCGPDGYPGDEEELPWLGDPDRDDGEIAFAGEGDDAAPEPGSFLFEGGYFRDPDAAAAHAVLVQGGYSTPLREAGRMIRDGGEHERRARAWMAAKGYTDADLEPS